MMDRLVHHAEVIALKGDSYRLKDATSAARTRSPPKTYDHEGSIFSRGGFAWSSQR
jgi:hypothetical protein